MIALNASGSTSLHGVQRVARSESLSRLSFQLSIVVLLHYPANSATSIADPKEGIQRFKRPSSHFFRRPGRARLLLCLPWLRSVYRVNGARASEEIREFKRRLQHLFPRTSRDQIVGVH